MVAAYQKLRNCHWILGDTRIFEFGRLFINYSDHSNQKIHSFCSKVDSSLSTARPFRSSHPSTSNRVSKKANSQFAALIHNTETCANPVAKSFWCTVEVQVSLIILIGSFWFPLLGIIKPDFALDELLMENSSCFRLFRLTLYWSPQHSRLH